MPFNFGSTGTGTQAPKPEQPSGFQFGTGETQGAGSPQGGGAPELPFMAQDIDKYGLPYYGPGLGGFAKKVFAKIFDPSKILPKPTEQQAQLLEKGTELGTQDLKQKGWDDFIGRWTGVSAEDAASIASATALSFRGTDEEGNVNDTAQFGDVVSSGAATLYRGGGQVISAGLEALGLLDKASRKVQTFNLALDEIGDTAGILPDISQNDQHLFKLFGENETTKRLGSLLNAFADIQAPILAYNLIRASTAGGKMADKMKTVKDNLRASNMVYTMYWDEAKKEEYFRRAQAGENPDLLVSELENPWVELAGSIFGDPSTYAGMGVISKVGKAQTPIRMFGKTLFKLPWEVVRLPGFTEILGLSNLGKARLASAGDEFTKIANPQTERALQALADVGDDEKAVTVLQNAVDAARKQVRQFSGIFDDAATLDEKRKALSGTYGILAYDSKAKAELTKKTVGTFIQTLSARFRNPDDILETFKAYKNLASDDNVIASRAFMTLKEAYGTLPFSNAGMQSMEFMTRLIDEVDIVKMVEKHGNDLPGLSDEAMGKLNGIIDDMFPSVNDLIKAKDEVKTLGKAATARQIQLAKSYDDLAKARPQTLWANSVNNAITNNKVYQGLQGFYANVLMGMRPAYAVRNLLQNSVVIYHDLGLRAGVEALTEGAEVLVKSTVGRALKQDWVTPVLERHSKAVKDILGFVPTEMLKTTGAGGKGFGFLQVGQDIEQVHSALITRYVVESEMEKFVRYGGLPDISSLGLPKEMAESLLSHATETYGNVKETLKRFRADQATGFYETWRHLELDPRFKDTLRRSNLLDELEDIRKTAPDAATFADRMDAFVNKIDELAQRTADEPALVSGDNPMADVVVTIEKAFDEGGRKVMSEDELNQFRALTELRNQLRDSFQDYVDVMRDRIGRNLPPEQIRPFEERFSQLRQVLSDGNSKWRNYADEVYNGIYARSKKGEDVQTLWRDARTVMLDMDNGQPVLKRISMADDFPNVNPAEITNSEFNGMLWRWFKEKQSGFWRSYTQEFMMGQNAILDEMAAAVGISVDEIKMAEFGDLSNPRLQRITDLTDEIRQWEEYIDFDSFRRAEPRATEINKVMETTEEATRAAGNIGTPPPVDQEVTIASDIEGNPLKLLQENGGVSVDEFSDIMSGKLGKDKKGVMPGLFQKNGMGLDDAGRVLADAGFITPEQADDLNFVREFIKKPTGKTKTFTQEGARLSDMDLNGVTNWQGGKTHLFNAVNADRAARGLDTYSTIDDVPFEEAVNALNKRTKPLPPYVETTTPTVTRQLYENLKGGFREALDDFKNGTLKKWGEKTPMESTLTDEVETALSKWAGEVDRRMATARASTATIANETRNFILHDYNKTYADKFASYFLMYHYWGSRTYARWGERLLDTPGTFSAYSKWKASMEKIHSDQPEFYRYNAVIPKLPGLNNSPMFFNLEATLNPLNSLTGVDFNDPKRRADWLSSAVDDAGKFGFNTAMPLQWLMAFRLYKNGEDEAARRWLGRMIPATQDLKAGLNLLKDKTGIDLMPDISVLPGAKYGEFDPFINFQGGFDAYEEKRIGRALSNMVMSGEITPEEAYDIMYNREGEGFDQAVQNAILERAGGQMASYFLGVGFKNRSEGDLKVEEFYQQYYKLLAMRENISPDDYRNAFDKLRGQYEFADTVLLSARGGDDRDAVYAYNVLSRIPPGDSYNLLKDIGLSDDIVQKFYNSKGDFSDWTEQDKERFMGAMLDIGATYSMPNDATRQEWNTVKSTYSAAQEEISKALGIEYERNNGKVVGRGVWDVVNTYYDLRDTDQNAAADFKLQHPEVDQALNMLAQIKIEDPLVAKYYASLDTVESYYSGKIRLQLAEEFGANITDLQSQYYELQYESKAVKNAFLKANPILFRYWDRKAELEKNQNQAILRIASGLPQQAPGAQVRDDFSAANPTQQLLAELSQGQQTPSWQEISADMSAPLQEKIQAYWLSGEPLSNVATRELEYLAKRGGYYNVDDLLRAAGLSLMQQYAQPQQAQQPPPQGQSFNFGASP